MAIPDTNSPLKRLMNGRDAAAKLMTAIHDSDAIVARLPSTIGSMAIDLAIKYDKPWAVELVGDPWHSLWNYGSWKVKLYAPALTYRTKKQLSKSKFSLYVTQRYLQSKYPSLGETVACSNVNIPEVDVRFLTSRLQRIQQRRSKIIFGVIGSLSVKYKGVDTILSAFEKIRNDLPSFEIRILGNGDLKPWRQLAAARGLEKEAIFCGTLPGGEPVQRWLDDIDIYLQPSKTEGLPRSLIEAMSRGCPAIASTAGGIPELLDEEYLIQPGDDDALAKLILRLCDSADAQLQQAESNFHKATEYTSRILDEKRYGHYRSFLRYAKSYAVNKSGIPGVL
ncbi:glycosyltransferase [Paenibacillus xerothermodurans]|uniref:glycosyltransferase n=1 Tax=Paenibacillus xerothermodurans TaxID=1977292 RepID=UPI001402FDE0|nr:glycosyltransferase [Paenibacillus xerothermodurans]